MINKKENTKTKCYFYYIILLTLDLFSNTNGLMICQAADSISSLPKVHKKQILQSNGLCPKFYAQTTSSPNTRLPGFTIKDQKASLLNPQ